MNINWDDIKQRPQFIAEGLSDTYRIDVVERLGIKDFFRLKRWKKRQITPHIVVRGVFLPSMIVLAFLNKWGIVDFFNGFISKLFLHPNRYDYVYVGSCLSYKSIRFALNKNTKLIYDCMDDEKEFPGVMNIVQYNPLIEKKLLHRADFILCTSEYLKQKLISRNGISKEIFIVPNGTGLPTNQYIEQLTEPFQMIESLDNVILYIGAIAPWFDFNSILYALDSDKSLNLVLVGPIHNVTIPIHPQIHALGSCEHRYIYALMKRAKILTMPFVVNELIRSVNPVKLYEYIFSGKPIIASRYDETEKFQNYAYLYSSKEEYLEIIEMIKANSYVNKQTLEKAVDYAKSNTWGERTNKIKKILM